jgi:hypothetical protein
MYSPVSVQNEVIFEDCNLEEGGGGPLPDYHLERREFKDPLVLNTDLVNGMTGNQVGHNLENISIFPDSAGSRPVSIYHLPRPIYYISPQVTYNLHFLDQYGQKNPAMFMVLPLARGTFASFRLG